MTDYYADNLSARQLERCYAIAPPRVRRYLDAEIQHVLGKIRPCDTVLELGCGYGRALGRLAACAGVVLGIDTSIASLDLARRRLGEFANVRLATMDAVSLGLADAVFDVVVCIQNGISAFGVDRRGLFQESLRVTKPGGTVLFSSYSDKFWLARLGWFELQAEHGLIGEIDRQRTRDGVIVCTDGFEATTVSPEEFCAIGSSLGVRPVIEQVDESSIFCEIQAGRVRYAGQSGKRHQQ